MASTIEIPLSMESLSDYEMFLRIKRLPVYRFIGRTAVIPARYAKMLRIKPVRKRRITYKASPFLFDYQRDIARLALDAQRFSIFADCGLGKTLIYFEWIRHVLTNTDGAVLLVCPLMVVDQTLSESSRFYGDELQWEKLHAHDIEGWCNAGGRLGITNFEAMNHDVHNQRLSGLVIDESSMLKSHYGKWGTQLVSLTKGLDWVLCGTGTPAPNDRIEYANHAVAMGAFPTINAFLARFFVNRGQVQNRWEIKPHAINAFYTALADWSIFLATPARYGWQDHSHDIPPINIHIHDVPLTSEQRLSIQEVTNDLFVSHVGGISTRSKLSQISKGRHNGKTIPENKTRYIQKLVDSWPKKATIIWCLYNAEQEQIAKAFPDAANITGATKHSDRVSLLADFQEGRRKVLITKPKILGFGLNLQIATRQIFSGLQDSYESFYQAVKRSNRVGSTRSLNVHIPITEAEAPMVENVLRKAKQVQADTEQQEAIFATYWENRHAVLR